MQAVVDHRLKIVGGYVVEVRRGCGCVYVALQPLDTCLVLPNAHHPDELFSCPVKGQA